MTTPHLINPNEPTYHKPVFWWYNLISTLITHVHRYGGDDMSHFKLKNKHRFAIMTSGLDCHHLCWTRECWDYGYSRKLRIHPYCIVFLPKTLHQYIHQNIQYVPVPDAEATKCALEQLALLAKYGAIHEDDSIEKRLTVLTALFECIDQPTANGFREQLRIVREFKKAPP